MVCKLHYTLPLLACVAGVLKGKGKGVLGKGVLGARETRAPRVSLANSLSLPFQTPATQAIPL